MGTVWLSGFSMCMNSQELLNPIPGSDSDSYPDQDKSFNLSVLCAHL